MRLNAEALAAQGFAYVGYKTQEAAAAALDQFNGIEFPPSSGQRLRVRICSPKACQWERSNLPRPQVHVAASLRSLKAADVQVLTHRWAAAMLDSCTHLCK